MLTFHEAVNASLGTGVVLIGAAVVLTTTELSAERSSQATCSLWVLGPGLPGSKGHADEAYVHNH